MTVELTDYLARVEQAVKDGLRGAQVYCLIEFEVNEREGYWERAYCVAWEREDQCGTHRVHIDSNWKSACFLGHYDMDKDDALYDLFDRASPISPERKKG